jgi:hypothetical protein
MSDTRLVITIGEHGCRVEGPIDDKLTCYGMLELARDAIKSFSEKQVNGADPSPLIIPSTNLRIE